MKKMAEQKNEQEEFVRVRLPKQNENEMFGIVTQMLGATQIKVQCQDGKERNCRIPGKIKKRVWLREGDVVIVKIWDFQPAKADVKWRFIGNQVEWLKRQGKLHGLPI